MNTLSHSVKNGPFRLPIRKIAMATLVAVSSTTAGQWISFDDETDQRLVTADPGIGALDFQEKDYAWGDVDRDGDIDITPPTIVHGAPDTSFEDHAFGGYIDPRKESTDGVNLNLGMNQFVIRFSEPVVDIDGDALTAAAFSITETGQAAPPSVSEIEMLGEQTVRVTLDRIITLQQWTTITVAAQDAAGNLMPDLGDQGPDIDEPDRVDVGMLPADIDQSGVVGPFDLLRYRLFSFGPGFEFQQGVVSDFLDMDRSGIVGAFDLLFFRQLIYGVFPNATRPWADMIMEHPRP